MFFMPLFILMLVGCVTIYNPATEKKELIFIDTASELDLGSRLDREIRGKFKVMDDAAVNYRLERIGQKVAAGSDRRDLPYRFSVIEDKELNAFAIPGGFIYINSGLMNKATDDELACVLGHEIGHVAARHSVKRIQTVLGYQIIMGIALGISGAKNIGNAVDVVFNVVNLGYSRSDEYLADKLAVRYAIHSGFDPNAMLTFFEKLKKEAEKRGSDVKLVFLSSHPPLDKRIENAKNEISRLSQQ